MDIYTLLMLGIKQATDENVLCSAGAGPDALQGPKREEGDPQREREYEHTELIHCCMAETNATAYSNSTPIETNHKGGLGRCEEWQHRGCENK